MERNLSVTLERDGKRVIVVLRSDDFAQSASRGKMRWGSGKAWTITGVREVAQWEKTTMTMTATEMIPAVGEPVRVRFEDLWIDATVVDVKNVWGKARLLIRPVAGQGQQWVELGRLETRRFAQRAVEEAR